MAFLQHFDSDFLVTQPAAAKNTLLTQPAAAKNNSFTHTSSPVRAEIHCQINKQ